MVVRDAKFVEGDGVDGSLAVGIDGGKILLAGDEKIAALFSGKGRLRRRGWALQRSFCADRLRTKKNDHGGGEEEAGEGRVSFHG
jgi:hypothetical protein